MSTEGSTKAILAALAALAGLTTRLRVGTIVTSACATCAAGTWTYTGTIQGLNPWLYWKLDETSGTTAADSSTSSGSVAIASSPPRLRQAERGRSA